MPFNLYDHKTNRIIKEEEAINLRIFEQADGSMVQIVYESTYSERGEENNYILSIDDVSKRYSPLHRIGCG